MNRRALAPVKIAVEGEEYDVVPCPWDGNPAPVWKDKRGQPWAKCMVCGCRFFGNQMAFTVGQREGRVLAVTWPPATYDGGQPSA